MQTNLATLQNIVSEAKRTGDKKRIKIRTPFFRFSGQARNLNITDFRNKMVKYLSETGHNVARHGRG